MTDAISYRADHSDAAPHVPEYGDACNCFRCDLTRRQRIRHMCDAIMDRLSRKHADADGLQPVSGVRSLAASEDTIVDVTWVDAEVAL